MLWYIEDSFVSMNVDHDLDRADNEPTVPKGNHWIISSKVSTGNTESIA